VDEYRDVLGAGHRVLMMRGVPCLGSVSNCSVGSCWLSAYQFSTGKEISWSPPTCRIGMPVVLRAASTGSAGNMGLRGRVADAAVEHYLPDGLRMLRIL